MSAARSLTFLAFLTFGVSCTPPDAVVDTSGVEAAIRNLAQTMSAYDFDGTKALFEQDGIWIEMGTKPIGLDSLSQRALPLQTLGAEVTWEPTNIRIFSEGNVAWATWCWCPASLSVETDMAAQIVRQIFDTADLDQRQWQMEMMVSAVLRKHGDVWLFTQGHVSQRAPANH
jgi:hypothetical protein